MFFNIDCYIVGVYEKKIKIHITDEESLLKFQTNINNLYKTKSGLQVTDKKNADGVSTFNLTYNKKTKFYIKNFNYDNIKDLVGVNVRISGESKYYSFNTIVPNNIENDIYNETSESKCKSIFKSGYSLVCNKIYDSNS
jgi:hypothetical protein